MHSYQGTRTRLRPQYRCGYSFAHKYMLVRDSAPQLQGDGTTLVVYPQSRAKSRTRHIGVMTEELEQNMKWYTSPLTHK